MQDTERIRNLEKEHVVLAQRVTHVENQDAAQWDQMRRYEERHAAQLDDIKVQMRKDCEAMMSAIHANKLAWSQMSTGTRIMAWLILALTGIAGVGVGFFGHLKKFFGSG